MHINRGNATEMPYGMPDYLGDSTASASPIVVVLALFGRAAVDYERFKIRKLLSFFFLDRAYRSDGPHFSCPLLDA